MLTQTTTHKVTLINKYVEHNMYVSDLILRSVGPLGVYIYIYIYILGMPQEDASEPMRGGGSRGRLRGALGI